MEGGRWDFTCRPSEKTCKHSISRDGNGARNILRVYESEVRGEDRPHELRYDQPRQVVQTLYKLSPL